MGNGDEGEEEGGEGGGDEEGEIGPVTEVNIAGDDDNEADNNDDGSAAAGGPLVGGAYIRDEGVVNDADADLQEAFVSQGNKPWAFREAMRNRLSHGHIPILLASRTQYSGRIVRHASQCVMCAHFNGLTAEERRTLGRIRTKCRDCNLFLCMQPTGVSCWERWHTDPDLCDPKAAEAIVDTDENILRNIQNAIANRRE